MYLLRLLPLLLVLTLCTCDRAPAAVETMDATEPPTSNPYAERIAGADERLAATEAGRLVATAIDAHGGLQTWYANGPLYYHFDYRPSEEGSTPRNTYILNDYASSRAVHYLASDTSRQFGFDGRRAWSTTGEKVEGMSPRFWSLTPYYFVGLPFVLADEGINFERLDDDELDGTTYNLVKVTYEQGTGDADGDYYVLYLNPQTKQLDALRYIVSYPGYFPDGGHLPEKLMRITGKTRIDGITVPTGFATAWWNEGEPGEINTLVTVSDYEFRPETDLEGAFAMPAGAKEYNDLPDGR